jgi:hypothetical protein
MFGELSKLFERNFAVGFFLPVFVWLSATALLVQRYIYSIDFSGFKELDYLVFTTVFGLLCLIGGILLLAVNRDLYRFVEGYGTYNPLRVFGWFEKRRYRSCRTRLEKLEDEFLTCIMKNEEFPDKSRKRRENLVAMLAVEFPEQEELLLPTPFGNALRSFESFPRIMYGLDSIPAWGRLLAVIPKEYFDLLDGAKAYVDFWVNLGLVFILLQIEYVAVVLLTGNQLNGWMVGLWIVLGTIAPLRATSSAREWGEFVKAAFDVFIPKLRETLGIEEPKNREAEFAQWLKFSQALIYRLPDQLPELKKGKTPGLPLEGKRYLKHNLRKVSK